jgi:hypothetical protein
MKISNRKKKIIDWKTKIQMLMMKKKKIAEEKDKIEEVNPQ